MFNRLVLVLPLFFLCAAQAVECTPRNASPGELQSHADWIIEGSVTMILGPIGSSKRPGVVIGDAKIIQANDVPPKGKTFSFEVDQCFLGDLKALQSKAGATALEGKAMRFYGRLYDESPRRRFFYLEPAAKPFRPVTTPARTKVHRIQAENPVDSGWHLARSTEGKFSVQLPGPFNDATVHEDGEPSFMLSATDEPGAKFVAVFERAGPRGGMGSKLEADLAEAGSSAIQFRGFPALKSRIVLPGSSGQWISWSFRVKAEDGAYALMIAIPAEVEPTLAAKRDRFFNSLIMR